MAEDIVPVRAIRMLLPVGQGIHIDCYEMPDEEKRIGLAGTSVALGHGKDWLGRLAIKGQKLLKVLQEEGYTGRQIPVSLKNDRGATIAQTISVRDFIKVVGVDATINRNPMAVVLLFAFAEAGVEKTIGDLFTGHSTEYLLQKIVHYSQWTREEFEEVLKYNREEVKALRFWRN